jgi:hypothetical protein
MISMTGIAKNIAPPEKQGLPMDKVLKAVANISEAN